VSYFNIHNHDYYSNASLGFPDVVCSPENLIQRAYDLGLTGIAITNHECISSYIKCLQYYNKMQKDRPFNIALGNECYLITEENYELNKTGEAKTPYYHFVLMALDTEGYHQICQLSTRAWERGFMRGVWRRPTLYSDLIDIIQSNQGHVIGSSACLGSCLDTLLLNKEYEEAKKEVNKLVDIFGKGNFYLEVQPPKNDKCDQAIVNRRMWDLHLETGIPIIPSTDTHYLSVEDRIVHKVFLQSQEGDREVDDFYFTAYLMDTKELTEHLLYCYNQEQIEEMIKYSNEIPKRIKSYDIFHNPIIPQLPLDKIPHFEIKHTFKPWYDKYPNFAYYSQVQDIHEQYFFYQIEEGLSNKIIKAGKDIDTYIARLDTEWNELRKISKALNNSMVSYYSTMSKLIDLMWSTGSFVGPGRGSSSGFLTCYLLNITQVDPVPLGDYFPYWRHMALERGAEIADIDTDSEPCKKYAIIDAVKNYFGEDKVLNVATFTVISSKTAIERACKGLNINDDIAGYLKSLIPVNRGKVAKLKDCIYGNEKEHIAPITELVNEMNKYPNLIRCALGLCDIVSGRSIHAAGLTISNEPYTEYIAGMRAPNGKMCTAFSLWDAEAVSLVKFDLLTVSALQKCHKAMDAMLEDGVIEWQGSVRETYDKYLHPDVLDYSTPEMWDSLPKMYSIFQFDTPISAKALEATHPKSVMDLSATNSLLRLMPEDMQETPVERYTRYKNNKQAWIQDTVDFGLNDDERDCLAEYLEDAYYLADSQEKVMRLSMDKRVAGYTLKESNKLRKSIARKDEKLQAEAKQQFFEHGKRIGTREIFLEYIWNVVFAASFGYSFSQLHSYVYSIIALQELNIYYHYNPVYWNIGCLTVEATPDEEGSGSGSVDYGEVAKAIYKMKKHGVNISPPSIQLSNMEFTPNAKDNDILYGLGAISGINSDIASQIISNRPYTSFTDFYNKNAYTGSLVTTSKFIMLIKAGCFDEFESNRVKVMKQFIVLSTTIKSSLTMANLNEALRIGAIPPRQLILPYNYKRYICNKQFFYGNHPKFKSKKLYWLDDKALKFFNQYCINNLKEDVDWWHNEEGLTIVADKALDKLFTPTMNQLKEYINTKEFLDLFNSKLYATRYKELLPNRDPNHWSFEATSFYSQDHELANIDKEWYSITPFDELPEEPQFIIKKSGGRVWKQFALSRIAGVVIARKDNNHLLTVLDMNNNVVQCKFDAFHYAKYKAQISVPDDKGGKTVVDASWFKRGQPIILTGVRTGENEFRVKVYKNSIFDKRVIKILNVDNNTGELELQYERYNESEEE
jgi:DNA polymerase-3 subunit alpha